jgi:ParB/RepB/Spo0J family partition protein
MKAQGLLEPLKVRVAGDDYEVVYGNHRLQAGKKLGWKSISCIVVDMDDKRASLEALVENIQRNEFVDPIAEAKVLRMLIEEKGWSQEKVGSQVGKSQQYVSSRLSLLDLEPELQGMVTSRLVSPEHGYELSRVEDSKKRKILAHLSVKTLENPLTLKGLRGMIKQPLEALSKDPRVDAILLQDPVERMRRMEARMANIERLQVDLKGQLIQAQDDLSSCVHKLTLLEANGASKRDGCAHYGGDACEYWSWKREVAGWLMKQDGGRWRLRVSHHPQFCATCPAYRRKQSDNHK